MSQSQKQGGRNMPPILRRLLSNKRNLAILCGGLLAVVLIVVAVVALVPGSAESESQSMVEEEDASSASTPWSEPEDDKSYDAEAGVIDKDSYGTTVLEKTKDAGREYLDETLFLGDSNTYRYMMYADKYGDAYTNVNNTIGVVSMGVQGITTEKCMQFQGYKNLVTMPEAVKIMQPRRIIIGFGSNNLTGATKTFIETYSKGLEAIHKAYPYADIIVNAVPPLDKQRENTRLTMKQVDAFNKAIAEMCQEEGYKFLDSSEALKDPNTGWAKKDYTLGDGVHLNRDGVTALFEYICTHAYITEDTRPKPLKPIPKAKGVPPGLIEKDPIAQRGAKVPVNFVASGEGRIEGNTSQMVKKGQASSQVTAVPAEGWVFKGWTASIGYVDSQETIAFTVPQEADANGVVITAIFEQKAHEHEWEEVESKEPTCGADGYVKYRCASCGEETKEPWGEATGQHTYVNGVCTVCGAPEPTVTPMPTTAPTTAPTATPAPTTAPIVTPEPTAAPTPIPEPTEAPPPSAPPVDSQPNSMDNGLDVLPEDMMPQG